MHKLEDVLENYCERITKELGDLYVKISKSDTLSTQDLDSMDKLLHALKSDKTAIAMVEYDDKEDDYSGKNYSGKKYYGESKYSGRRYSRDSERDDMVRKLEDMMRNVRDEDEAMAIRDGIDTVNRMR